MTLDDIVKYLRSGGDINKCNIIAGTEEAEIVQYMWTHPGESSYTARQKIINKKHGPPPKGFDTWGDYWKVV